MKALAHKLEKLCLSERESAVYLATLEAAFGLSIASIAKKTEIKRSTVYLALEALKQRGLISVSKRGNRHIYVAEDPRVFQRLLAEQDNYLKGILPELLSATNMLARKPVMRFFERKEGIKEVYRDTLERPNSEILAWATDDIEKYFDVEWLTENYVQERVKSKIHVRVLAPDTPRLRQLAGEDVAVLRTLRLLTPGIAPYTIEINLYGGRKVAFVSFRESFGIIIESAEIFATLRAIFQAQWGSGK